MWAQACWNPAGCRNHAAPACSLDSFWKWRRHYSRSKPSVFWQSAPLQQLAAKYIVTLAAFARHFFYYIAPVSFYHRFCAECGEYFTGLKAREKVLVLFAFPRSLMTVPSYSTDWEPPPAESRWGLFFPHLASQLFCLPCCENVIRMIPHLKSSLPECILCEALSHFVIRQVLLSWNCFVSLSSTCTPLLSKITSPPFNTLFILIWCFNPVCGYFRLFNQNSCVWTKIAVVLQKVSWHPVSPWYSYCLRPQLMFSRFHLRPPLCHLNATQLPITNMKHV